MSRLAAIHRQRAEELRREALARASRVMDGAARHGLCVSLIGSLARADFQHHSDVDFFVHGNTDPQTRLQVERLVASAFHGADIPYDIVYASDLTPARAWEFLGG